MNNAKEALATLVGAVLAANDAFGFGRTSGDADEASTSEATGVARQANQQAPRTGLVFVNDYQPGVGFRAVSRIQQPTVNQILGYANPGSPGDGDGAVVDPTDWNGYIINYVGCGPGNYDLVFLREGFLEAGQTYSFTTNAVFFSNSLQLVEPEIRTGTPGQQAVTGDDAEGQAEGEAEAATEETTTEETTTDETTTTETETTTGETTTTEATTTETETPATEQTTTAEQSTPTTETTAEGGTTTTTAEGTTTTTTSEETTTQEVVVNATETTTESG